jgi:hypothetical protein
VSWRVMYELGAFPVQFGIRLCCHCFNRESAFEALESCDFPQTTIRKWVEHWNGTEWEEVSGDE